MSDEVDDRPIYEGEIFGKYKIRVLPIGDAIFRANLVIYNLDDEILYQREVLADRNLEAGAGEKEYKQWQRIVIDWVLNKS